MPTPPPVCAACQKTFGAHFEIVRFDVRGARRASVKVCSALCLMRWAYGFSVHAGERVVTGVRDFLSQLVDTIRPPS